MMEFLDWSGDEVLLVDGRTKSSNASALVRWNNKKVLSFSQSLVLNDTLRPMYDDNNYMGLVPIDESMSTSMITFLIPHHHLFLSLFIYSRK